MGIFDGMTGVLNGVFGAPVAVTTDKFGTQSIDAIFRREPVRIIGDDNRETMSELPTLSVPHDVVDAYCIVVGSRVEPGDGATYRIVNHAPSGSPASDAFTTFELEEV